MSFDHSPLRLESHFGDRIVSCYVDRPANLNELLAAAYRKNPNGDAIVFNDERISWAGLKERVGSIAAGFRSVGVGRGDRVAVMIGNRTEFVLCFYALSQLGAVLLPLSTRYKAPEVAYAVNDSGSVVFVGDASYAAQMPARADMPSVREVFVLGETAERLPENARPFSQLTAQSPLAEIADLEEEEPCAILYTSGTTGKPKGAVLTHLGVVHSSIVFREVFNLTAADRSMAAVPVAHVTGLIANITTMAACAGALIILPEFKAKKFLKLAEAERMTHTLIVPAMYSLMLLDPELEKYDLSAWRIGGSGGAPLPEHVHKQFAERVPGLNIVNAYGATETTSPSTVMPFGMMEGRLDSIGKPVPGCVIVVVDEQGREVAAGETGEIWIGGPHIVSSYFGNPKATAEGFTAGFWHSGDVGAKDPEGFIRIFDRKKDMIIRGGLKIFSSEVEGVIMEFPGIVESAVVSRPCPVLGERVHCFVHGTFATAEIEEVPERLRAFLTERLADYKVPETVIVSGEPLPRNANGKIIKRQLREQIEKLVA